MDQRGCIIFPPTTPWAEFPAKREKELAFALVLSRVLSESHSTPKDLRDVVSEYARTPRMEESQTPISAWLSDGRGLGANGSLIRGSKSTPGIRDERWWSLAFDAYSVQYAGHRLTRWSKNGIWHPKWDDVHRWAQERCRQRETHG